MFFITRSIEFDKDVCKQTEEGDFYDAELTLERLTDMSLYSWFRRVNVSGSG